MTKIDINVANPDGTPRAYAVVTMRLVDGGAGGSTGDAVVAGSQQIRCDDDGYAQVDLIPNDDITPAGSFYTFTVDGAFTSVRRHIEVPAANGSGESEVPFSWSDPAIQVDTPVPPEFVQATGPQGATGSTGATGATGPAAASAGLLSAIPLPASVAAGYRYYATDEGVGYTKSGALGSGSWIADVPLGTETVELLTPTSSASFTVTTAGVAVPGMTSAAFTYDGRPIRAIASGFAFSQPDGTTRALGTWVEFTKNGGTNWYVMGGGSQKSLTAPFGWIAAMDDGQGIAPTYTRTLTVGDTVQVRVRCARTASTDASIGLIFAETLAACPTLLIQKVG